MPIQAYSLLHAGKMFNCVFFCMIAPHTSLIEKNQEFRAPINFLSEIKTALQICTQHT